jgi:hypothetical protein
MNFENMTIGQIRKLTEDYERLQIENKLLKVKYPNKFLPIKSVEKQIDYAEQLIEELK